MKKIFLPLFVLVCLLAFPLPVQADVAPPAQPPGSTLLPGMKPRRCACWPKRLLEVQANTPDGSLGQAKVSASFTMLNTSSNSESMAVRFPLSSNDGFYNYPEIAAFTVKVNGSAVTTRHSAPTADDPYTWAEFDAVFPPGQEVLIEVRYTLEGTGEYPFISFAYLLETGAGWKDTIGSAEVVLRLPYDISVQNVFIDSGPGWGDTTSGSQISDRELRWQFEDLEPSSSDNIQAALVMPSAWKKLLSEQANVDANPRDGEAWGRLGKI